MKSSMEERLHDAIVGVVKEADPRDNMVRVYGRLVYWCMGATELLDVQSYCDEDVDEYGQPLPPLVEDEPTIVMWTAPISEAVDWWDKEGHDVVVNWWRVPELKQHRCAENCGSTGSRFFLKDPYYADCWLCSEQCVREHVSTYSNDELLHLAEINDRPVKQIIYDMLAEEV